MKKYDYNAQFFGQWLNEHPEITKRDILTVIKNKDYGSLKRWAEGDIMPTHTILRLCNHYGIDIWNFFLGMRPAANAAGVCDRADGREADASRTVAGVCDRANGSMSDTDVNVLQSPGADVDVTTTIVPDINVKKAQWEARYQKDLHVKQIEHQRQMDALRKEYEERLEEQRRDFMATINKQVEQIMALSSMMMGSSGNGYGGSYLSEGLSPTLPNKHPDVK